MATYYIASPRGPLGPYDIQQLRLRPTSPDDLVWTHGMPDWAPAATVPELQVLFDGTVQPPIFDKQRFNDTNATIPANPYGRQSVPQYMPEKCPPTYLWLSIISFLGVLLFAIIALYKSLNVKNSWREGNYDKAQRQSRAALTWSIISLAIGTIVTVYTLSSGEDLSNYNNLIDLLNK